MPTIKGFGGLQQRFERALHFGLRGVGRKPKDAQIILVSSLGMLVLQAIVRTPKREGGKHLLAISIPSKRSRLSHERFDHVAIVDSMGASALDRLHFKL